MRTLVEQTADGAREWFSKLAAINEANRLPRPEDVHVLMGGVDANEWLEEPERPAVLVGTQDMLLSRALMRGYASSRALWPMGFALLHEDAQWVFDEVQLMGAGRATSAQLAAFRQAEADRVEKNGDPPGMPSRSLWISATLDPGWLGTVDHVAPTSTSVVKVDPVGEGGRLERLARATKRLHRSQVAPTSSKKKDVTSYIRQFASEVLDNHRPGQMTLAIVNRVDRAQALHDALGKEIKKRAESVPTLALVHSRFRPADRRREMEKATADTNSHGRIVVATQAIEAGVDISAAVLFTEIAPWSSMIQRFGRTNRYAELPDGADVHWIDLLGAADDGTASEKDAESLAKPYVADELRSAREHLAELADVAPAHLPAADAIEQAHRVIRRKDIDDLFDTDPDLTGFDVDVSAYVRDADDTDIRVFWRDLTVATDDPPRPRREELCAVSIGVAREWLKKLKPGKGRGSVFRRDPQWRRSRVAGNRESLREAGSRPGTIQTPAGWTPFRVPDQPWPGLVLLADRSVGGYLEAAGFTGNPKNKPVPVVDPADSTEAPDDSAALAPSETDGHDEDRLSAIDVAVPLIDHLRHVAEEAEALCDALDVDPAVRAVVDRAARWHDLGKAHDVFQDTMRRGLGDRPHPGPLLAKTVKSSLRHKRAYFRHELASALAFLDHENWSREADLISYLIAAHHGKVRMNLRALPRESAPPKENDRAGARFARGIWEGDELPAFELEGDNERWEGGELRLSIMELGWDEITHESWTERTRDLLDRFGPFRLAWLETLLRVADWRASKKEEDGSYDAR